MILRLHGAYNIHVPMFYCFILLLSCFETHTYIKTEMSVIDHSTVINKYSLSKESCQLQQFLSINNYLFIFILFLSIFLYKLFNYNHVSLYINIIILILLYMTKSYTSCHFNLINDSLHVLLFSN